VATVHFPLWRRALQGAARLVYPATCPWCGRSLRPDEDFLGCATCLPKITRVRLPFCHRCGAMLAAGKPPVTCARCLTDPPHFDRLRAVLEYNDTVRAAVVGFKYRRQVTQVVALAQVLARVRDHGIDVGDYDFIAPVPLHAARARWRWFNQSLLLAAALPEAARLPLAPELLFRNRNTPPQASLPRRARLDNVKNAFSLSPNAQVDGKKILLIDDVATTGATLSECARPLKEAGAAVVDAACLARAGL
jgi:ComF family protein